MVKNPAKIKYNGLKNGREISRQEKRNYIKIEASHEERRQ